MDDNIRQATLVAESAGILAWLVQIMSPGTSKWSDILRAILLAALCSGAVFVWLVLSEENRAKAAILAVSAGAIADFVVIGGLKILAAFKRDPLKTIREFKE